MDERLPSTAVIDIITADLMFAPILAADPSFWPAWNEYQEDYGDEPQPMHYLALSALARHLIGCLERGDTSRFGAIFDVVEVWHVKGDQYVREAATVGLLEDIQNTNLHSKTTPEAFLPWLRPESRRWWDKVEEFWERGTPIRER